MKPGTTAQPITPQTAYEQWLADPTPERMATTLRTVHPVIMSEIQRYPGPKNVLQGKARQLAVSAVRTYNPASGTKFTSWLTTQLQPLNRYGRTVSGSVRVPEVARRQAAELETRRLALIDDLGEEPTDEQLADDIGLSVSRIAQLRNLVRPVMSEGAMDDIAGESGDDEGAAFPGVESSGPDPALRNAVDIVYRELDERDKRIMEFKTGHNGSPMLDNRTIAKRLGVSPALVSQRGLEIAGRVKRVYANV